MQLRHDHLPALLDLARIHAEPGCLLPEAVRIGACYSNGRYGEEWAVRQVADIIADGSAHGRVIYRGAAGVGRRRSGECSAVEFADWARYEVTRQFQDWHRAEPQPVELRQPALETP